MSRTQLTILQTCISAIAIRHLAIGHAAVTDIDQLRAPMAAVISGLADQMRELERYKAKYGPLHTAVESSEGEFEVV